MSTLIARDPFARGSYRRWTFPNRTRTYRCRWCGDTPRRLYSYTWESDASTARDPGQYFCHFACFSAYHGG